MDNETATMIVHPQTIRSMSVVLMSVFIVLYAAERSSSPAARRAVRCSELFAGINRI